MPFHSRVTVRGWQVSLWPCEALRDIWTAWKRHWLAIRYRTLWKMHAPVIGPLRDISKGGSEHFISCRMLVVGQHSIHLCFFVYILYFFPACTSVKIWQVWRVYSDNEIPHQRVRAAKKNGWISKNGSIHSEVVFLRNASHVSMRAQLPRRAATRIHMYTH